MGNSTTTLQSVVDFAQTMSELSPVLKAGGYVNTVATTIATDVMATILSSEFNWRFNRFIVPPFLTTSWQQDYAIVQISNVVTGSRNGGASVTNLAWLEHGIAVDINNTSNPKPQYPLEVVRMLESTFIQYGRPGQIAWLPNDQLKYGTWGAADNSPTQLTFGNNPQPSQVITNPLGAAQQPRNPATQIQDANGNFLVLTQYGTTGTVSPLAVVGALPGTIVPDGTCIWTVVDPKGQGLRLNPIPPQQGLTYMIYVIGQMRPPMFGTGRTGSSPLNQLLDPLPDDYAKYFRQGFITYCYRHSPEEKIRGKFAAEYQLWIEGMTEATKKSDRERDSAGFYPTRGIMDNPFGTYLGPSYPFPY